MQNKLSIIQGVPPKGVGLSVTMTPFAALAPAFPLQSLTQARRGDANYPIREYLIALQRKRIETTFSDIAKLFPKSIHAVTKEGFIIKLIAFIWAYTFNNFHKL